MRPTSALFSCLAPCGINGIYCGAVTFGSSSCDRDRYAELDKKGLVTILEGHPCHEVNTEAVKKRVMDRKEAFIARQRAKGTELPRVSD
jgi:hypothetical protein